MDSQNISASQSPSSIDPEDARRRFLASMGIADPAAERAQVEAKPEPTEADSEEEVALPAQPENMELPGVNQGAPARSHVISFDVKSKAPLPSPAPVEPSANEVAPEPAAVKVPEETPAEAPVIPTPEAEMPLPQPAEEAPAPQPEAEESAPIPEETPPALEEPTPEVEEPKAEEPENLNVPEPEEPVSESVSEEEPVMEKAEGPLQLVCPKCHGELVLMPQHIGVEGACVWCDTKIVAARANPGDEVRVFALFQPASEKSPAETAEVSEPAEVEASSPELTEEAPASDFAEGSEMVSRAKMEPATMAPGFAGFGEEEKAPQQPQPSPEEPPTDDWASGFSGEAPEPAPAEQPASEDFASPEQAPQSFEDAMKAAPAEEQSVPAEPTPQGFEEAMQQAPAPELEKEAASPAEPTPQGFEDAMPSTPVDPFADSGEMPQGFGSEGVGSAAQAPEVPAEEESASVPEGFSAAPTGFSGEAPASVEEAPKPEATASAEMPAGFADGFSSETPASEAAPDEARAGDEKPSAAAEFPEPWGATEAPDPEKAESEGPAGFSASPFADAAPAADDLAPLPTAAPEEKEPESATTGFSEPAPWGPPTVPEGAESPAEEEKAPEPASEAADFGAGFSAAPPKAEPEMNGAPASWGESSSQEESASWGVTPEEKPAEPTSSPEFAADQAPSPVADTTSGFGSGFEIPASDSGSFPADMGISDEEKPTPEDSIFADAETGSAESGMESWGGDAAPQAEEAPAAEAAEEADEPIFESAPEPEETPAQEKPQLFGGKSNDDSGDSLFGAPAEEAAISGPPPLQGGDAAPAKSGNGLFSNSTPQVTSQPLGDKTAKKKKGKGLVVLLVVILGLVCGAALASFVLPVDEYVAKAQSFMEEKLNMEPDVDPATFLSEMMVPAGTENPDMAPVAPPASPAPATPPAQPSAAPASVAPQGSPAAPAQQSPTAP